MLIPNISAALSLCQRSVFLQWMADEAETRLFQRLRVRTACSPLNGASLSPPPRTREVGAERMKSQRLAGVLWNTIFCIWYGHCNHVLTCTISTQNQAYQVPLVDGGGAHEVPLQSGCQRWGTSFPQWCKPLLRSTQISLNSPTHPHSSSSL